jgi:hypothetical protein
MKILFVGDTSNYHRALAVGLTKLGHDVTVASDGTRWMNTYRDIDLSRSDNPISGALLWLRLRTTLARRFRGYDVVQLCGDHFVSLKPGRLIPIFHQLQRDNGAVFVTALGKDPAYIDSCMAADCPLRYTEFSPDNAANNFVNSEHSQLDSWLTDDMRKLCHEVYCNSDGIITALYEYQVICRKNYPDKHIGYGGIPINCDAVEYHPNEVNGKVKILLGAHRARKVEKGAERLQAIGERLAAAYPDRVEFTYVENRPYTEFLDLLSRSNIVLDQLYSYTPATTALLAMAMGRVTVSGGEREFYDFLGNDYGCPIINADPWNDDATYAAVEQLILHPEHLRDMGEKSRRLVQEQNSDQVVAQRFVDFWESII